MKSVVCNRRNVNILSKNLLCVLAFVFLSSGICAQATTTIVDGTLTNAPMLLEVWGAQGASVSATPVERISPNGNPLYGAYDINITKDGKEWQPEPDEPAIVTMEASDFVDGQMLDIYHEGANGPEFIATVAAENGKIVFPAPSFSVYIVAQSGEYARLKVTFHRADNQDLIIYVKKADISHSIFNDVVFNPGLGKPLDGEQCRGWIANSSYTVADTANAITFTDIRTAITARLNAGITDGDEMHFYAMRFKAYTVTYLDENNAVVNADEHLFRYDAATPHTWNYTVNAAYTPGDNTTHFDGWNVYNGGGFISGHTNGDIYPNGTNITISGNVSFSVKVSAGHWLVFHENGKGATYKAADFINAGAVTVEPPRANMRRNGYTFDDWYLGEPTSVGGNPTGERFVFGRTLNDNTHVYAKWNPQTNANYTIIIWKQNVSGVGYDYDMAITLSGTVGQNISTVVSQGSGNARYARINGVNYSGTVAGHDYTGFHLYNFDTNVRINTEGNSVLNVYYNRNQHTLTFQAYVYYNASTSTGTHYIPNGNGGYTEVYLYYNDGNWYGDRWWLLFGYYYTDQYSGPVYDRTWSNVKVINALYGQPIGDNFPIVGTNGITYNNYIWEPGSNGTYSQVLAYIDAMPDDDVVFGAIYGGSSALRIHYYIEVLPGETSTRTYNGIGYVEYKSLDIYGYRYFTKAEDYINIVGYSHAGSEGNNTYVWGEDVPGLLENNPPSGWSDRVSSEVWCYFNRIKYTINFMNGAYYDGNNNNLETDGATQIGTERDIAYGANVRDYNTYTPANRPGFVFEGWYADKTCTQPFNFTIMPEGGITVYAKWRQIQYRVFLHPNADHIPDLNWGTTEQAMNFRIDYGGHVSAPTGTSANYEFVGWFTDVACTNPFTETAIVLNEETVTADYDKENDLTDNMDWYGNIDSSSPHPAGTTGPGYNSDSYSYNEATGVFTARDRFWITKKYDIYGKWRAKVEGADGIKVEYAVNGGNSGTLPVDTYLYQDNVDAIAGHACSYANASKEFSHWVMQRYNVSSGNYEDISGSRIFPGDYFVVQVSDSKREIWRWYDPLHPDQYVDSNSETVPTDHPTYTKYRANYTLRLRAEYVDVESRTNTSIVWYKNDSDENRNEVRSDNPLGINEVLDPNSIPPAPTRTGYIFKGWYKHNAATPPVKVDQCEPNFLYYNGTNYYKEAGYSNVVTKVAADIYNQTDYMYAIWQPDPQISTPAEICPGTTTTLATTTDSYNTYSWSNGTTGHQITTDHEIYTTTYTVTVTDVTGCTAEKEVSVPVKPLPTIAGIANGDMLWFGIAFDSDWATTGNWLSYNNSTSRYALAGALPSASTNVYIITDANDCVIDNPVLTSPSNAKNVTIGAGRALYLDSYAITLAGNLDNAGTFNCNTGILNIAGNLSNTGTFNYNTGTVVFNGTSQTITNAASMNLYDVEFDQSSVGTITAANGITVNHAATFTKGVVVGDATFEENSRVTNTIAEMTRASYVDGLVTKKGSETFTFPTGGDGVLGAFSVTLGSNTGDVNVKFNHSTADNGDGTHGFTLAEFPRWWNINDMCSGNNPQLDHVSNFEYWKVEGLDDGTSLSNLTLKVDADAVTEHFHNPSAYVSSNIYAVAHYDCWKNLGEATVTVSDDHKTITVADVSSIPRTRAGNFDGIVTLGSTDHSTVLPIELTALTATCDGRKALVEWTTASERNNDYFSLERSDDAINFTEIARIAGAGNSIAPLDYSYTDYGVHGGDNYYRLVQVDYDGTRTASEIVVANCIEASGEPEVLAYPNPFSGDLTVELENFGDRPARIDVYDMLGRLVYTEEVGAPQNSYQTVLHFGNLPDATYTVRVGTADFVINRKVVKQQ